VPGSVVLLFLFGDAHFPQDSGVIPGTEAVSVAFFFVKKNGALGFAIYDIFLRFENSFISTGCVLKRTFSNFNVYMYVYGCYLGALESFLSKCFKLAASFKKDYLEGLCMEYSPVIIK